MRYIAHKHYFVLDFLRRKNNEDTNFLAKVDYTRIAISRKSLLECSEKNSLNVWMKINLYKNSSAFRIYYLERFLEFMNPTKDLISYGMSKLRDAAIIVIMPPIIISFWKVKRRFLKRLLVYLLSKAFLRGRKRSNLGRENPSATFRHKCTGIL